MAWRREDILKNVGNQTVSGPYDVWQFFLTYYESQWEPATVWLPIFFKISSSTDLDQLEDE